MKNLLIVIFFALFAFSLSAQTGNKTETISVKGQIVDSLSNESVPYTTIKIVNAQTPATTVKALATDESGKFQFQLNKEGEYILIAQYVGKATVNKPINLKSGDKLDLGKILMTEKNTLQEVVVSAIKPLVKIDLDKITYSTEDDPDSKTNNVLEMLKKVPMITVDAEDNVQLKGSSSFKIYLDGKPSNLISNNPAQVLKSMPANTVKNIEVITDPGAKYDAEGVNGIINIVTNKQPLGGYTASVNAGANTRGGYNLGAYLSAKYGKFGFTGNYNLYHHKSPESESNSYRRDVSGSVFNQQGTNSYKANGQYGYGELSYEIDTLNLLSFSFNKYGGKAKSQTEYLAEKLNNLSEEVYSYNQDGNSSNDYGSTELSLDYQRTFRKKDELLTASYRLSLSPNNSDTETDITEIFNYINSKRRGESDAEMKEHTFQLDYTTPLAKIHTIEAGVKYIIRLNESNSGHDFYNFDTEEWIPEVTYNDQFKHRQDILSAYTGYNVKRKKIGFKAGLRLEETLLKATFPIDEEHNFDTDYFNLIPSATLSYQLKPTQNFRLGYNMRIQRPGIWYLNPYLDQSNPKNIFQGNPDLEVEKSHNFNLNYSLFTRKVNLNTNLFYNYLGNSIQQVTTLIHDDVTYTTYENLGKKNDIGTSFYINWNPTLKLRIYTNTSVSYTDIRSNNNTDNSSNSGFVGRIFGGIQYTFPYDFSASFNGGYASPSINLQGENTGFQYTSISLNKSFLNKKLTVSISGSDIFTKNKKFGTTRETDEFYSKTENFYPGQNFRIGISYRFGEMKQQIKKVNRKISNDDNKAGEGNSGEGGGGQGN